MILGIVGLLSLFLPLLTPASIIALVLGNSARKKLIAAGAETGAATAGIVMGVVGIALGAIGFFIGIAMLAYMEEQAARQPEVILVDPLWWLW
jgi:NAD/NADP transhydrogenase alpha subunit